MHNIVSSNQLAEWNHIDKSSDSSEEEQQELVNDYFNCLIECEDDQSSCKRICKEMLI